MLLPLVILEVCICTHIFVATIPRALHPKIQAHWTLLRPAITWSNEYQSSDGGLQFASVQRDSPVGIQTSQVTLVP